MKKVLWLIVCLMTITLSVNAQSSPMEKISDGKSVFHVHFGVGTSGITGDYTDNMTCKNVFVQSASVGVYVPLGVVDNLYFGGAIGYGSRGHKDEFSLLGISSYGMTFTANYIQLSPSIGYISKVNDNIFLDLHLGAYYSSDLSHEFKGYVGSGMADEVGLKSYEDKYNKDDIGVVGGVGVWYKNFGVDLSFSRGFKSLYNGGDAYNQKFMLTFGYAF